MKRYLLKRFSSKAVFAFCVILLTSFSSPSLAVAYSPSDCSQTTAFTGLDVPASADIRMIFNNASLLVEMAGGSSDSESFTDQVVVAKGRILNFVTSDKSSPSINDNGSPSIKKLRRDDIIRAGAIVTPEPATVFILGLGSLVLIRKSRSEA